MSLPMLQVALDNQTLSHAYETTRLIAEEVDIIEVGTILCVGEGVRAVRDLKALYPHKIVLADAKIADAGKILSRMCFEANADWVTVICCADINTAKGALDVAKEFNGDVQIELTGFWTWEQAQEMEANGISIESHTVSHKSMTELSDDELRAELVNSKKAIEDHLGKQVDYIAYPTGTYNLHIAQLVKDAGYKAAFTIKYGNVDKASNLYALERVPIFHTEDTFKSFLERIRYVPIFERFGWIKS